MMLARSSPSSEPKHGEFSSDFGDLACLRSNIIHELSNIEQNRNNVDSYRVFAAPS